MKVAFVSSMLPSGHYSQYITSALARNADIELYVFTDKNKQNLKIGNCGTIRLVWSKSVFYLSEIVRETLRIRPDVVHLQHELNMYGGILTAAIFLLPGR